MPYIKVVHKKRVRKYMYLKFFDSAKYVILIVIIALAAGKIAVSLLEVTSGQTKKTIIMAAATGGGVSRETIKQYTAVLDEDTKAKYKEMYAKEIEEYKQAMGK